MGRLMQSQGGCRAQGKRAGGITTDICFFAMNNAEPRSAEVGAHVRLYSCPSLGRTNLSPRSTARRRVGEQPSTPSTDLAPSPRSSPLALRGRPGARGLGAGWARGGGAHTPSGTRKYGLTAYENKPYTRPQTRCQARQDSTRTPARPTVHMVKVVKRMMDWMEGACEMHPPVATASYRNGMIPAIASRLHVCRLPHGPRFNTPASSRP
jgi:hypothetical protein